MKSEEQLLGDTRQAHADRLQLAAKIHAKGVVTTHELARMMKSSTLTIQRCFDSGKIQGQKIPSKNGSSRMSRKIPLHSALTFMQDSGHDIQPWLVRNALVSRNTTPGIIDGTLVVPTVFDLAQRMTRYAIRRITIDASMASEAQGIAHSIRNFYPKTLKPSLDIVIEPAIDTPSMQSANVA